MHLHRHARWGLALAAFLLLLTGCDQTPVAPPTLDEEPPIALAPDAAAKAGTAIPGRYIIVFRDDVADAPGQARSLAAAVGGQLHYTYRAALKGFAASLPEQALEALQRNPNVRFVEQDAYVQALAVQANPPSWGLDRVDQRNLPRDNSYTYIFDGAGVTAFILDTGIRTSHNDFGGRASVGFDAIGDGQNGQDCHGHGTHVAGTVGGSAHGVAKQVSLVAVRVLNCAGSGTFSGVIAGIDYVTERKQNNPTQDMVANMSLGGGFSSSLNDAVERSVAAGVTYAVAAGNSNFNACSYSPSSAPSALTVGATTSSDARASYSNYGTCLDLFAPGSSIISAWHTSNTATNTISGTSMASPHVAGVAALYLDQHPGAGPATVAGAIVSSATSGVVSNPGAGSPNLLLYGLFGGSPAPSNDPPTAGFSSTTSGLRADFTDQSTDADGIVVAWAWDFGDGSSSTAQNPSHTYAGAGTYTVGLTVTDDDGATDAVSKAVTVTGNPPPPGGITLTANGYKQRGDALVNLSWSGADGSSVNIYRNDEPIETTANDGSHTDVLGKVKDTKGTWSYQVCEAGTSTCSDPASVTF